MKRIPFNYRDVAVGERDKFCLALAHHPHAVAGATRQS